MWHPLLSHGAKARRGGLSLLLFLAIPVISASSGARCERTASSTGQRLAN